jgi:glycosyltransferase involved in cell wall biosynthesis
MVSAPETFGLSYLEAMAAGNIVIGAKGYGIDGIVRDGINGFLCNPRSIEELASVVERIALQMPDADFRRIVNNSVETAKSHTAEIAADIYLGKLRSMVGMELLPANLPSHH